jgi:hypothetical protein
VHGVSGQAADSPQFLRQYNAQLRRIVQRLAPPPDVTSP